MMTGDLWGFLGSFEIVRGGSVLISLSRLKAWPTLFIRCLGLPTLTAGPEATCTEFEVTLVMCIGGSSV
jgi:hypothetical protein